MRDARSRTLSYLAIRSFTSDQSIGSHDMNGELSGTE